jgi:hypothetical protein
MHYPTQQPAKHLVSFCHHYAEGRVLTIFGECHYAECRYTDCLGANEAFIQKHFLCL